MKSIPKTNIQFNFYHLPTSTMLDRKQTHSLRPETLSKKGLWHRYFPVNFAKFLRTPFFAEQHWTAASLRRCLLILFG